MRVALVSPDLLISSRISGIVERAGSKLKRIDDPTELTTPDSLDLVLVDWAYRRPAWPAALAAWRPDRPATTDPRIILFGPHTDLEAHAAARNAGLGPMWARSRLLSALADLIQ